MKLEQQVVSLELSKRLRELCVKQESLFYWTFDGKKNPMVWDINLTEPKHEVYEQYVSAFTVAELGEMLPVNVLWKLFYHKSSKTWNLDFGDYKVSSETEADARAKMLVYLLENKLITL